MMEQQLFSMLEQHIQLAKQTDSVQQKRDHIVAAKTLCELLLTNETSSNQQVNHVTSPVSISTSAPVKTLSVSNSSILEEEDGANGASIFDF
jgi:hypothetical protein